MPFDNLGPASAPGAVTARPADDRTLGGTDTWFKDCTSAEADDGTEVQAAWLNAMLAQLRRAIVGMGITARDVSDPLVDDMLLDAIKAVGNDAVTFTKARLAVPLMPHVQAANGLLTVNPNPGNILVNAGQYFVLRGVERFATDSDTVLQRTLNHVANKTYHARFDRTNGFRLRDLADAGYNPTAAAESSSIFDSTEDDMLFARVVTNGANTATITSLANRAALGAATAVFVATGGGNARTGTATATLNWARSPLSAMCAFGARGVEEAAYIDLDEQALLSTINRYSVSASYLVDYPEPAGIHINFMASA